MPAKFYLLSTTLILSITPVALASQSNQSNSIERPQFVMYSQPGVDYHSSFKADTAASNLQRFKRGQVVAESIRLTEVNRASLLGEPQQIQLPVISPAITPVPSGSAANLNTSKPTFNLAPSQAKESDNTSLTSPQPSLDIKNKPVCLEKEGLPPPDQPLAAADRILIRDIVVSGYTILKKEINEIVEPCKNQFLTPEQQTGISDAITRLYLQKGYITSRANKPERSTQNGNVLRINVIEGSLEQIEVVTVNDEGKEVDSAGLLVINPNYVPRYICKRIQAGLGIPLNPLCNDLQPVKGNPLNTRELENQLRLLSLDHSIGNINPVLKRRTCEGHETCEGQSILRIEVQKARFLNFSFNNYSPPSIGAQRAELDLRFGNLAIPGDNVAASYSFDPYNFSATRGFNSFVLGYQLPLSPRNDTLQLRLEARREKIVQAPFDQFDFRAKSELYEVVYRYPLIRSYSNELALSLGFTHQNGQTFVFNNTPFGFGIGPDANGVSRTSVLKFAQEYIRRDENVTWAMRSQFNLGVGLFGATRNPNPIPDGKFISWLGQAQRVQRLSLSHLLIVEAELQLTPNSLLPSQQFVIGGGQSVRGYRQNARFGDNGFRLSIENQIDLVTHPRRDGGREAILQIAPFVDAGMVWNRSDNPNKLPNQTFLAGVGTGILWQTPLSGLTVRVDYGFPLVDLRDRGKNIQDDGLYFNLNYQL